MLVKIVRHIWKLKMKNCIYILIIIITCNLIAQKEYLNIEGAMFQNYNFKNNLQYPQISFNETLANIYLKSEISNRYKYKPQFVGSICNSNGDKLFYTNGRHLFNAKNELIYKNNSFFNVDPANQLRFQDYGYILSDSSGGDFTQIVKAPGCNNHYYVFYTSLNFDYVPFKRYTLVRGWSLYYYKFDFTNDKFTLITKPKQLADSIIPAFGIAKAQNNIDIWILTRKLLEHKFSNFKIEDNDINTTPVETKLSKKIAYLNPINYNVRDVFESFIFLLSPNSKYFNVTTSKDINMIYKFDNKTGSIKDLYISEEYKDNMIFSPNSQNLILQLTNKYGTSYLPLLLSQINIKDIESGNFTFKDIEKLKDSSVIRNLNRKYLGPYNQLCYTTNNTNSYYNHSISRLLNTDSSYSKVRVRNDIIDGYAKIDSAKKYSWPDINWVGYLTDTKLHVLNIPGGYYGTDVYKEKCESDSLKLQINYEIDEKDSLFEWTGPNGFNSKLRNPILFNLNKSNQGWYDLKVFDPRIQCFRNFSVHIEVKDSANKPKINVIGEVAGNFALLAKNETLKLYVGNNTNNCEINWSNGETSDTIIVNKTGRYYVNFNTDRWCENFSYIDVIDKFSKIEATDGNFAKQEVSTSKNQTLKLRISNKSTVQDLKVYAYKNSNPDVFVTDLPELNGQTVIQFKPLGYYEFTVEFRPKVKGKYFDSIVFFSNADEFDSVAYLTAEAVDTIFNSIELSTLEEEFKKSQNFHLYDVLGRFIFEFDNIDILYESLPNYQPPYLIKWLDRKGFYQFSRITKHR